MDDESDLRQEIEFLKNIYLDDLHIKEDDSGRPIEISVQLQPAMGECADQKWVCLNLQLTLSEEYPATAPLIRISNPRGLTEHHVIGLQQTLLSMAEEGKGDPVLYNLIEYAKESLTVGNVPQGQCTVCLEELVQEFATRTACYHYFHSDCLRRYISHSRSELEERAKDNANNRVTLATAGEATSLVKIVCPVCREHLNDDLIEDLECSTLNCPSAVDETPFCYVPSVDTIRLQRQMSALFRHQLEKGGIIDEEAERNKYLVPKEGIFISLEKVDSPVKDCAAGADSKAGKSSGNAKTFQQQHRNHKYDSAFRERREKTQQDRWKISNREDHTLITDDEARTTDKLNHSARHADHAPYRRPQRKLYQKHTRGENTKRRGAEAKEAVQDVKSTLRSFSDGECAEGDDIVKNQATPASSIRDSVDTKCDLESGKIEQRDQLNKYGSTGRRGSSNSESADDKIGFQFNESSNRSVRRDRSDKFTDRRVKSAQYEHSTYRNVSGTNRPHDRRTNFCFRNYEQRENGGRYKNPDSDNGKGSDCASAVKDVEAKVQDVVKLEGPSVDVSGANEFRENPLGAQQRRRGNQSPLERPNTSRQVRETASGEKSEDDNSYAKCLVDSVDDMVDSFTTTSLERRESRRHPSSHGIDNRPRNINNRWPNTGHSYNRSHYGGKTRNVIPQLNVKRDENGNAEGISRQDADEKLEEYQQPSWQKPRDLKYSRSANYRDDNRKFTSSRNDNRVAGTRVADKTADGKSATGELKELKSSKLDKVETVPCETVETADTENTSQKKKQLLKPADGTSGNKFKESKANKPERNSRELDPAWKNPDGKQDQERFAKPRRDEGSGSSKNGEYGRPKHSRRQNAYPRRTVETGIRHDSESKRDVTLPTAMHSSESTGDVHSVSGAQRSCDAIDKHPPGFLVSSSRPMHACALSTSEVPNA